VLCYNDPLSGAATFVGAEPLIVSSQTRNEIAQIIHDAGFRSNLNSDLLDLEVLPSMEALQTHPVQHGNTKVPETDVGSGVHSPTPAEFPSSPPNMSSAEQIGDHLCSFQSTPQLAASRSPSLRDDRVSESEGSVCSFSQNVAQNGRVTPDDHRLPISDTSPQIISTQLGSAVNGADDPEEVQPESSTSSPSSPARLGSVQSAIPPASSQGQQSTVSAASSTVPNPFYDQDQDERKSVEEMDIGEEPASDLPPLESFFASTAPPQIPSQPRTPPAASKRKALSSPRQPPSSLFQISDDPPSPAVAPANRNGEAVDSAESLVVVDLTGSSPPQSPGGSDEDFAKSRGLPHGPGWVPKHLPPTQRRTRASTGGLGREENSISPPPRRRGTLRRGARKDPE
jgi:hypothetical protein